MEKLEIPFVKFPQDWEIKFIPGVNNGTCLFRFLVKKEKEPNVVSVVILQDHSDDSHRFWEVEVCEKYADGSIGGVLVETGEATSELNDVESLLKSIETFLHCEIPDYFPFEEEN